MLALMTDEHKDLLHRKLRLEFLRRLELDQIFMGKMMEDKHSMTDLMKEKVEIKLRNQGRMEAVDEFLTRLIQRPDVAFGQFLAALQESEQDSLWKLVQSRITDPVERDQVDHIGQTKKTVLHLVSGKKCNEEPLVVMTPEMKESLRSEGLCYLPRENNKHSGRVILVNIDQILVGPPCKPREGSQEDSEYIIWLSKQLGFDVVQSFSVYAEELVEFLKKEAEKEDLKKLDVLIIVLMAHGEANQLICADRNKKSITDDILPIFSDEHCPNMKGKPKLYFIQACQVASTKGGNTMIDHIQNLPNDTFIGLATVEGYAALRDGKLGSLFIRALVYSIAKHSQNCDMSTIHEVVAEAVLEMAKRSNVEGDKEKKENTQVSRMLSTLGKKFYFFS